jgi:hypothetical protein
MDKKATQKTTSRSGRSGRAKSTQAAGTAVQEPPPSQEIVERPGKSRRATHVPAPTHEQIAQRAQEIWRQRGCPHGQDKQHWLEAEEQLKREMSTR